MSYGNCEHSDLEKNVSGVGVGSIPRPGKRAPVRQGFRGSAAMMCATKWILACTAAAALLDAHAQEPLDPSKREQYGEFYDPAKYQECRKKVARQDIRCEYLNLKRHAQPEYWPYPEVATPKLPEPRIPSVYKQGMNAEEYFRALCAAEAGEFIFRTVDNVDGIYQIRPRKRASDDEMRDRYVMEDPYGYSETEHENPATIYIGPGKYSFLEVPVAGERKRFVEYDAKYLHESIFLTAGPGDKVARFFGSDGRTFGSLRKIYDKAVKSKYGYTWREIRRPHDRELAIVGGELIVLDLKTNEVLGIRRGFIVSGNVSGSRSGVNWQAGAVCPADAARPGLHKDDFFSYSFLRKILKPGAASERR